MCLLPSRSTSRSHHENLLWLGWNTPHAGAQDRSTAVGTANARVIKPITLEAKRTLDFGSVITSSAPGTVKVTPGDDGSDIGSRILKEGVMEFKANKTYNSAKFALTGEPGFKYGATLPDSIALDLIGGPQGISMTAILVQQSQDVALDATGVSTVRVGATLQVGANQPAGNYLGTFPMTVNYN